MNAPYGDGRPERRRKDTSLPGGRREDDPNIEMAGQFGFWAKLFVVHRVKIWAFMMSLSAISGAIVTASLLAPRVTRLEHAVSILQTDVGVLKQTEVTKMYILCTLLNRVDPVAVPSDCDRRANKPQSRGEAHAEIWDRLAQATRYLTPALTTRTR